MRRSGLFAHRPGNPVSLGMMFAVRQAYGVDVYVKTGTLDLRSKFKSKFKINLFGFGMALSLIYILLKIYTILLLLFWTCDKLSVYLYK
jgi:hypothetical protein